MAETPPKKKKTKTPTQKPRRQARTSALPPPEEEKMAEKSPETLTQKSLKQKTRPLAVKKFDLWGKPSQSLPLVVKTRYLHKGV